MSQAAYPPAMRRLVNELSKLPSIGEKSAARLAYHLLTRSEAQSRELARAILDASEKTVMCRECFSLTEETPCNICRDPSRDRRTLCVVEKPADVIAIERSGRYKGLYHVLHGLWSPLKGVGLEQTKIGELLDRLRRSADSKAQGEPGFEELIIATSTTVEGDATALYIKNGVSDPDLKVSRIAQGLPKGGELEYTDEMTLFHALEGRRVL